MRIFLIGFMGSGKTHWGRVLAAAASMSFVDLDEVVEKEEKKSIKQIFDEEGETYFRQAESKILRIFFNTHDVIMACGGGTPCFHKNMEWMNAHGTTVYLKATPAQLANRLITEKHKRPVLNNIDDDKLEGFIAEKLNEREPFYQQAKIILDEEKITVETVKEIILSDL